MPSFLVPRSYGQETPEPLRESKELLRDASDALRAVVARFGADWPRLAAAFPEEGFTGDDTTLTACEPPEGSAHGGVTFTMATKQGGTSVYNVEDRCTRCGDAAGNERVHVFQSGVTMEKYAGYAIDSIDEIGDAQAVPADKLYEYRRQERARQEQEAAAAHATAHMVQAFAARVKQVLAAIPLPSFGRVIGKSTMPPQGADAPTIPVVPDGPLIRPSLITRGTLELMLRKHADTLQAAAAILGQNVGMLQTRIAELKQQETTAKETVATQPEQQPETPAPQEEQK